jgi:hypothetical protein
MACERVREPGSGFPRCAGVRALCKRDGILAGPRASDFSALFAGGRPRAGGGRPPGLWAPTQGTPASVSFSHSPVGALGCGRCGEVSGRAFGRGARCLATSPILEMPHRPYRGECGRSVRWGRCDVRPWEVGDAASDAGDVARNRSVLSDVARAWGAGASRRRIAISTQASIRCWNAGSPDAGGRRLAHRDYMPPRVASRHPCKHFLARPPATPYTDSPAQPGSSVLECTTSVPAG